MDDEILNNVESNASPDNEEAKGTISADLIRGHINTIILRTLYERDKYGYEIIEEIESKSHGQYTLKQPTLYSALKRLESQGYINAYWKTDEVSQGGRRKYYTLTDNGREIAEKNQAEWEYSRTVIDSLISDKNFDFSQPAPSAVDFKILKSSTSRVPSREIEDDREAVKSEEKATEKEVLETTETEKLFNNAPAAQTEISQPIYVQPQPQPTVEQAASSYPAISEEERQKLHENYLKLISEPVATTPTEPHIVPNSDEIDTEKLIYNNRPETERDYRNLINNLFIKTVRKQSGATAQESPVQQIKTERVDNVRFEDVTSKSEADGLTVYTADAKTNGSRKKRYNLSENLFKSSLIIAVIMLLEFALCLIFRKNLKVTLAYPFVILAIACAQVLIFGVIKATNIGKNASKPASLTYLTAAIIVCVLIILMICVIAILLNVDFSSVADIMAKIVIPCFVSLNIPAFAVLFCLFGK